MSAISLKSITGITSITTPAGVDDQLTLHNNNTTEAVKLDVAGNLHVNNQISVTGIITASQGLKINVSPAITIRDGTTEKGYIGFNGNDPFIGRKNGVGVAFQNNKIRPVDGDDGSGSNNTVDIGENTYKFKDAYFSGTVTATSFSGSGANLTSLPAQATIANNADNRVITGGSGVNLNGEANLTFDGSTLGLTGSQTISGDLSIAQNLVHTGDTDTKLEFGTNTIKLFTAGVQKFRIYDDGVVAIGQSSKSGTVGAGNLDIQGNATNCIIEMGNPFPTFSGGIVPEFRITATNSGHEVKFESVWGGDNLLHPHIAFTGGKTHFYRGTNSDEIAVFDNNKFGVGTSSPGQLIHTHSGSSSGGLQIQSNGSTNYIAAIQTANNFANGSTAGGLVIRSGNGIEFSGNDGSTIQMRLASSGDVTVSDGNLVIGTSGHGIDFSATSDNSFHNHTLSELLDDYEEGSWQPTWSPASGSIGHQSRHGDYIKIGRVVHCMFAISANGSTNPSGELKVSGLPFSAQLPNASGLRGGGGVAFAGYHMNADVTKCMAQGTNVHIILSDNSRLQSNSSGIGYGYNAAQLSGFFSYITA